MDRLTRNAWWRKNGVELGLPQLHPEPQETLRGTFMAGMTAGHEGMYQGFSKRKSGKRRAPAKNIQRRKGQRHRYQRGAPSEVIVKSDRQAALSSCSNTGVNRVFFADRLSFAVRGNR